MATRANFFSYVGRGNKIEEQMARFCLLFILNN